MTLNPRVKTFAVPRTAQPRAMELIKKIADVFSESYTLDQIFISDTKAMIARIQPEIDESQKKYEAAKLKLGDEIVDLRKTMLRELCDATGAPFDPDGGLKYAVETAFVEEHGQAFLSVLSPAPEDAAKPATPDVDPAMLAPPGTRLN